MLEIDGVTSGYGRTSVIFDVSLRVADKGIVAVLGNNGAGKSTLLRTASGLLKPTAGRVRFNGQDVTRMSAHRRAKLGLGYVPQGQQAFGDLTTRENLQLVADQSPRGRARLGEVVDLFPALGELMGRRAGLLSGGQRQQLALARALLLEPSLLMLDEPTEGIQPSVVQLIERTISALAADGLAVLLVEQHVGFALEASDSYVVLASGRIRERGDSDSHSSAAVRSAMAI